MDYPKWKYHVTLPGVIVNNEQEEADLGPDWVDEHVGGFAVPDPETVEYETVVVKKGPGRPKKVIPAPAEVVESDLAPDLAPGA